jgi:hypothetical protein
MAWKNGGGETVEIAVSPEGAGLDTFDWRISMARVDGDGPFSLFAGVDRTLAIIEGAGLRLHIEGLEPRLVTRESLPFSFPADRPTRAETVAGPVRDFNVMSRRGRVDHKVEPLPRESRPAGGAMRLLLSLDQRMSIGTPNGSVALGRFDGLLLSPEDGTARLEGEDAARGFLVTLAPAASKEGAGPNA